MAGKGKGGMAMLLMGKGKPAEEPAEDDASEALASETLLAAGQDLLDAIQAGDAEAVAAALKASHTACMDE